MNAPPARASTHTLAGRLARTLILWVGGTWLLCVFAVAWYVDREIDFNFDSELVEVSHRMFDIALRDYDQAPAALPPGGPQLARPPLFAEDEVPHRLIDAHGRVLLRTARADDAIFDVPLAPGFANSGDWRIYTVRHPDRPLLMQVADPLDERRRAVMRTLVVLIAAMLAVLPLLALGLRQIARRELQAVGGLAAQVERRGGNDLSPLALAALPQELQAMGDGVNRLLERLQQALQVERALAANAAHELRTPLAAVRLRLQTALDHDLPRAEINAALAALQTLSHRAEKLLQLSRAESGAALARAPVNLVRLAAALAEEFWQDPQVATRLHLQVPETEAPQAWGDVDALAIALRNLLENALRHSSDTRVELIVHAPATLIVRDFGPGASPDQLATLRERHVRHSDDRAGYGLGMSIVSTIVRQHEGRLALQSPWPGAPRGFEARIDLPPASDAPG